MDWFGRELCLVVVGHPQWRRWSADRLLPPTMAVALGHLALPVEVSTSTSADKTIKTTIVTCEHTYLPPRVFVSHGDDDDSNDRL